MRKTTMTKKRRVLKTSELRMTKAMNTKPKIKSTNLKAFRALLAPQKKKKGFIDGRYTAHSFLSQTGESSASIREYMQFKGRRIFQRLEMFGPASSHYQSGQASYSLKFGERQIYHFEEVFRQQHYSKVFRAARCSAGVHGPRLRRYSRRSQHFLRHALIIYYSIDFLRTSLS